MSKETGINPDSNNFGNNHNPIKRVETLGPDIKIQCSTSSVWNMDIMSGREIDVISKGPGKVLVSSRPFGEQYEALKGVKVNRHFSYSPEKTSEENISPEEVKNSSVLTGRSIFEGLTKAASIIGPVLVFGNIFSVPVSAAEIVKGESVTERYGGALAGVDKSSIQLLGTIETQPRVMRPDNGATIIKTSGTTEVKKAVYYNLSKELNFSSKVLEVLEKRTDKATSVARAVQFMAGGEYLTEKDTKPLALKAKITRLNEKTKKTETLEATVVFADKDLSDAYKKLNPMEKASCTPDTLSQSLINKIPSFSKIRKELTDKSFIYVFNGETYVFTDQNLKPKNKTVIKYSTKGEMSTVVNDKAGSFYFSKITYDKELGICAFDGTKVTRKYNSQTKKFDELTTPKFFGTLKQRTIFALEAAYNLKNDAFFACPTSNPLGIDLKDIEEYRKAGNTDNCKTIKEIVVNPQETDPNKKLSILCLIGGIGGFQKENSLKNLKLAIEKCNKIDPKITQKWVERGLNFITVDNVSKTVFSKNRENWMGTFNIYLYGGTIFIHEDAVTFDIQPYRWFSLIEEESLGLYSHAKIGVSGWTGSDVDKWKEGEYKKSADKYLKPGWEENGFGDTILS